jgi:hypothetical protein
VDRPAAHLLEVAQASNPALPRIMAVGLKRLRAEETRFPSDDALIAEA